MSTDVVLPLDEAEIQYPETDGEPMGQGYDHLLWIVMMLTHLRAMFSRRNDVAVHGDMFWYPVQGDPTVRKAPDVMVAFGRSQLAADGSGRLSYRQWIEGGVAPQVAFEAMSNSNTPLDLRETYEFYEHFGVEEYYVVDPKGGDTVGYLRNDEGLFEEIPRIDGWVSPRLGIRFEMAEGKLLIRRPDGRVFDQPHDAVLERDEMMRMQDEVLRDREAIRAENVRMGREIERITRERDVFHAERDAIATERDRFRARATESEARAAESEARATESEARARRERERAERLATLLRELGVDPDATSGSSD